MGITGIAGPTGGTAEKPVGLVYIAVADGKTVWVKKVQYAKENDRSYVRTGSASHALNSCAFCWTMTGSFSRPGSRSTKKAAAESS